MSRRRRERGLALVVVLWGVAALSLIAAAMLATSLSTAHVGRNAWNQVKVQTAADAGVHSAILSLFNPGPAGRPPLDGKAQTLRFDGAAVTVSIQDESGRIDLNAASRDLLRDYFKAAGADDPDTLADRVVDWRSPKEARSLNSATAGDYERSGSADRPRGAPFQSVDELNLVLGMTPQLYQRLAPGLTVYSHGLNFDMRTAPREVLAVIPGMNAAAADNTIAARPATVALPGHAFAIVSTAARNQVRFTRRAVVLLTADPRRPYWILDWK
jgi:general secretion pathway protein K